MSTAVARDAQRSRVYEVEHLVWRIFDRAASYPVVEVAGSRLTLPVERKFASLDSVQAYAEGVLGLGWVREGWARAGEPVLVRERAGVSRAHYERAGGVIAVPTRGAAARWALRELVVLHELAHHLEESPLTAAHGPAFVDRFAELVGGVVGPEAALLLRVTMLENGVRVG